MSLKKLAQDEAALRALIDFANSRLTTLRAEMQTAIKETKESTGMTGSIAALLPDGEQFASIIPTKGGKAEATVVDEEAFLAWVRKEHPGEIHRYMVTEVRPAYRSKLLGEMTAAKVPQVVDTETGVVHTVPGVELKPTRKPTHQIKFVEGGQQAALKALVEGHLNGGRLLALESGSAA